MDVQSAANLNIPEGSVRNIHDKDKRLLWSAVGYNVRYDGDATQQTYAGKNICYDIQRRTTNSIQFFFPKTLRSSTITISTALNVATASNTISLWVDSNNIGNVGTFSGNAGETISRTFTFTGSQMSAIQSGSEIYLQLYKSNAGFTLPTWAQIEPGSTATDYEPYVGGIPAPNPDYPQDIHVVQGKQTVVINGKNFFSLPASGTRNNVTYTKNSNDSISMSSNNASVRTDFAPNYFPVPDIGNPGNNVTITISTSKPLPTGMNLYISGFNNMSSNAWVQDIGQFIGNGVKTSESKTVTLKPGITRLRTVVRANLGSTFNIDNVFVQAEIGSTATAFEQPQSKTFTVGLGSIELCKFRDYQDYIFKSSGKNLVDAIGSTWQTSNVTLIKTDGIFRMTAVSGKVARAVLPLTGLIEGETYTISFDAIGVSVSSDNSTHLRIREGSSSGEWIGTGVKINASSGYVRYSTVFVATSVSDPWAWFYLSPSPSNTNNVDIYVKNIQLEKGSYDTPYEPYGTDWYVHKDMDKVILDGTGTWSPYTYHPAEYTYMHNVDGARSGYRTSICSHFTNVDGAWQEGVGQPGYYSDHPTLGRKYFVSDKTTVSDFTTWLSSNNVLLRFALETPTDTKITDSTLVAQLDAIHDWLTRYDYCPTVTGDLPIVINRVLLT